jgi:hypothetical protein
MSSFSFHDIVGYNVSDYPGLRNEFIIFSFDPALPLLEFVTIKYHLGI